MCCIFMSSNFVRLFHDQHSQSSRRHAFLAARVCGRSSGCRGSYASIALRLVCSKRWRCPTRVNGRPARDPPAAINIYCAGQASFSGRSSWRPVALISDRLYAKNWRTGYCNPGERSRQFWRSMPFSFRVRGPVPDNRQNEWLTVWRTNGQNP